MAKKVIGQIKLLMKVIFGIILLMVLHNIGMEQLGKRWIFLKMYLILLMVNLQYL